jgi:hypothetical protein
MDSHTRVVAGLHIAFGLIGAFFMLIATLAMGGVMGLADAPEVPGFLLGLGLSAFIVLLILALAQAVAGFALLKGSGGARIAVIVFGVLGLLQFPFGTALGMYTLWALLIRKPDSRPVA